MTKNEKCGTRETQAKVGGAALALVMSACQTNSASSLSSIDPNEIGRVIEAEIEAGEIPGGIVLIADNDGTEIQVARGYASVEREAPIDDDTIFRFYSMTKPITCTAVLTLLDEGLIALDDPIADYIPEMGSMKVVSADGLVPAKTPITIRHLMTHTSGLAYAELPGPVQDYYVDAGVFAIENRLSETLEQHISRLAEMPLVDEPGTVWNYGESMGVLGRLVEVVTGQTFGDYLRTKIFDPLEMTDTGFYAPAAKADRLADLYHLSAERVMTNITGGAHFGGSYSQKPDLEYGGAGLVGTPKDYKRFAMMLLNRGTLDGHRILSEDAVSMMTSNQLPGSMGEAPLASAGRGQGTGFGFCGLVTTAPREDGYPSPVGEYGWGGWASTDFWIDPAHQLAGLVFTQVIPEEIGSVRLSEAVRRAVYNAAPTKTSGE